MNMPGKSILHLALYRTGYHQASTQLSEDEQRCLGRYAGGRTRLVEIGAFEGASTRILTAAAAPSASVYAIDPFLKGRLGVCWGKPVALREIRAGKQVNPQVRVNLIERFSYEAASEIGGDFDFIFIDGDHSHEGIRRDWNDWGGRVREDGIMAMHDTRVPSYKPSVQALGSFQYFESTIRLDPRFELIEQVDSLSILRRRSSS